MKKILNGLHNLGNLSPEFDSNIKTLERMLQQHIGTHQPNQEHEIQEPQSMGRKNSAPKEKSEIIGKSSLEFLT